MSKELEVIFDANPSGGCGCNCGCEGSNIVDDINELVDNLKNFKFDFDLNVDSLKVSDFETEQLIIKINSLLDNTNATFRVDKENLDEALSNILPLIVLDGNILTAYGVPTLNDVVTEVNKNA